MSDFLKMLPIELQMLDKITDPISPIQPNETQIGVVTDDTCRKLYSMHLEMSKEAEQVMLNARYNGNPAERDALVIQATELGTKANFLEGLFWILVRDDFKHWQNAFIGIRAGWSLVEFPEPPHMPFFHIMGDQQ